MITCLDNYWVFHVLGILLYLHISLINSYIISLNISAHRLVFSYGLHSVLDCCSCLWIKFFPFRLVNASVYFIPFCILFRLIFYPFIQQIPFLVLLGCLSVSPFWFSLHSCKTYWLFSLYYSFHVLYTFFVFSVCFLLFSLDLLIVLIAILLS